MAYVIRKSINIQHLRHMVKVMASQPKNVPFSPSTFFACLNSLAFNQALLLTANKKGRGAITGCCNGQGGFPT